MKTALPHAVWIYIEGRMPTLLEALVLLGFGVVLLQVFYLLHYSCSRAPPARTIPLTHAAFAAVREALQYAVRPIDTDLLFWGEPGRDNRRRPYEFHPAWRRAINAAGIADLRFHDLRHEAVSRLIDAGLGDQEVAAISGHKCMQMLRRYTHLRAEDLVHRLDQLGVR